MKKWQKASTASVLALGILSFPLSSALPFFEASTAQASAAYTYEVTAGKLNIRAAANTQSKVLGSLRKGVKIEIQRITTSGWVSFQYKGKIAYASAKFMLPIAGTGVTKTNLHLRKSAAASSASLLVIPAGKKVTVHEWAGDWARIDYNGTKGWASSKYLMGFE
ncbi:MULTISPECIES: SH3 domain-containing protein [Bacillaceae]|uniref:SH3 domain-containing protein n=1 Tax=Metabacillus sediminis TaxID=3117746 RepID=A0ABZ2NFX3_9BACI|nr:SH3 domain-containing protein [Bacillus sp. SJS]KZZ83283.1 hypothetical protein AS29_016125 [Bacillus sp. SJS]